MAGYTNPRDVRWMNLTGLSMEQIKPVAAQAYQGYVNNETCYGNGYQAGETHMDMLPPKPEDRRIVAWGDYLIDLEEFWAKVDRQRS